MGHSRTGPHPQSSRLVSQDLRARYVKGVQAEVSREFDAGPEIHHDAIVRFEGFGQPDIRGYGELFKVRSDRRLAVPHRHQGNAPGGDQDRPLHRPTRGASRRPRPGRERNPPPFARRRRRRIDLVVVRERYQPPPLPEFSPRDGIAPAEGIDAGEGECSIEGTGGAASTGHGDRELSAATAEEGRRCGIGIAVDDQLYYGQRGQRRAEAAG
mmetsp:Transcript_55310/g.165823  ORF Transcript_55310/g.165823 Transcript_55310/m.165823 type:complete len:212 (+) Transcript_55310:2904-3539(+)